MSNCYKCFIKANIATLIPLVAAMMTFFLVSILAPLPADCQQEKANPLLCHTASNDRLDGLLKHGRDLIWEPDDVKNANIEKMKVAQTKLTNLKNELENLYESQKRPLTPASANAAGKPDESSSTTSEPVSNTKINAIKALIDLAEVDVDALSSITPMPFAASEAKLRVTWMALLGMQYIATAVAFIGCLWILVVVFEEFGKFQMRSPKNNQIVGTTIESRKQLLITALLWLFASATLWATACLVKWLFFNSSEEDFSLNLLIPDWNDAFDAVASDLMQKSSKLVEYANLAVTATLIIMTPAIAATLLQRSDDPYRRICRDCDVGDEHKRYITRCFQRLTTIIALASTMMVASVAQIATRYNWPVALFNGESSLATNLNSLGSTMALGQGMVYTSVLFALFFPTAVILRRRAWQVALSHSGNDSMKNQVLWLDSEQMSFSLPKSWLTGVAILAPVTAGIIPDLTSSILG